VRQTIADIAMQLLKLEGEHIEVIQNTAAGKCGIISDAKLDMLLDRRKEVFEAAASARRAAPRPSTLGRKLAWPQVRKYRHNRLHLSD